MSGLPAFHDKIDQWVHGESPGRHKGTFPGSFNAELSRMWKAVLSLRASGLWNPFYMAESGHVN